MNLDIGSIREFFRQKFTAMFFRRKSVEEAIDSVKNIPKPLVPNYKKFFGGMGESWLFSLKEYAQVAIEHDLLFLAHTGIHLFFNRLLRGRRLWGMIIHNAEPMTPLFFPPMNWTENTKENYIERCRLGREAVIHWPSCPACQEKWFWKILESKTLEEAYVHFDDREHVCANKKCIEYGIRTGVLVADIQLANEKDTKSFAKIFIDARIRRQKSWDQKENIGDLPIPVRWTRYWNKLGYVFHRRTDPYAADLIWEQILTSLGIPFQYSDLDNVKLEEQNPYPNG